MYVLKPMTERVKRTRERYRTTVPKICIARYKLITEFYQAHPELTGNLRRAYAMKHIFDNIPLRVEDDDIIVGAQGTTFRSCALYPEYGIGSLAMEIKTGNVTSRKYDPYLIDEEDGKYVMETAPYWQKMSLMNAVSAYKMEGFKPHDGSGTTTHSYGGFGSSGPVGHFVTGYNRAVRKGFGAIKAEADAKIAQFEEEGVMGKTVEQYYFYKSISIVCEGMINLTKRYAKKVEEMAAAETRPERKAELERMAECLNWTMEKPARNFLEAVQCLFMYQTCLALEGNMHGMSWGRIDQYLGDFYDRDIQNGTLTPEYGQEILDMFYLKVAEMNKFWGDGGEYGIPGYTSGQLITLGGQTPDGKDATNAVTFMCLQCAGRLVLHDPPQAVRFHKGTPDELWEAAIQTTRICGGVPSMENDEVIIPALLDRGLSLESARNYAAIGCVEPGGCGDEWPACGGTGAASYFNMANALWLGINNGINIMPGRFGGAKEPQQTGLSTGYLKDFTTMQQVLDGYKAQTEFFVKWHVALTNNFEYIAREVMPLPVVSATMDGCMEKGADVMWGGAKFNSTGLAGVGIGNVADSLQMIDHLCFNEKTKRCTPAELYDALVNDWAGHEALLDYVRNEAPHYGNGDPEADKYADYAAQCFADAINSSTGPRGRWSAGLYPVTTNVAFGRSTAATPDGRHRSDALADGISPVQQMDKNGPTCVLVSTGSINQRNYPNGTLLNMKFSPSCLNGADGIEKLKQLLKTYFFDFLGMEVQINVVSTDTMRDAQAHPENYRDLVVRIAGFSVYFVEMHRTGQNDLISRTELSM